MLNSKTVSYPFSISDLKCLIDYSGGANPVYIGYTSPGMVTSAAAWQIRRITYDASNNVTAVEFAGGGNDYNQVWDNRAALSYS